MADVGNRWEKKKQLPLRKPVSLSSHKCVEGTEVEMAYYQDCPGSSAEPVCSGKEEHCGGTETGKSRPPPHRPCG